MFAGYDDGQAALFVTTRDAQRSGNIATVWMRTEYRDRQTGFQSVVVRRQFDCVSRTTREIAEVAYALGDMLGKGVSATSPNSAWEPIVPGSGGEAWIDWACKAARLKNSCSLAASRPVFRTLRLRW
jgi:hypothetical protein